MELAIVLVIIGLIVGGVLVGQDLIKASEIRALVSTTNRVQSAVHTFRTKYNYLPGDIPPSAASSAGLTGPGFSSTRVDGFINGSQGNSLEYAGFWYHLYAAGMLNNTPCSEGIDNGNYSSWVVVHSCFYASGLEQVRLYVYGGQKPSGSSGADYTTNRIVYAGPDTTAGGAFWANHFTPTQVHSFDMKLDDGLPKSGNMIATGKQRCCDAAGALVLHYGTNAVSEGAGGSSSNVCVNNTVTPNAYNTTNDTKLCTAVMVNAGF